MENPEHGGLSRIADERDEEQPSSAAKSLADEYRNLSALRGYLNRTQARLSAYVEKGEFSAAADFETDQVDPAFDAVVEKERRILAMEARTARDLAIKVIVCAENEFASDILNEMLEDDARRFLAAA